MTTRFRAIELITVSFTVVSAVVITGCHSSVSPSLEADSNDQASETTEDRPPSGRLSVEDGKFVDETGNRVSLFGLALGPLSDLKSLGHWNEAYFENARSWGADLVRLPVNPGTFREDRAQTLLDLDDAVRWCERHNLYLIVGLHAIGNVPDGLFLFESSTGATWSEINDFWETVGKRYADNPRAAFAEIYNEPSSLDFMGALGICRLGETGR